MVGVVHVVNVSGALPVDLVDGPYGFCVAFVEIALFDLVPEFVFEGIDDRFYFFIACWWRFV